ncbi:hypothetical protein LEMLEM_LOCUS2276 [Lemmus lemmus]
MGGCLSGVASGELQDAGSSNLFLAGKTTSQRQLVPPPVPLSPPTFQTAPPLSPSQHPIFASTMWMLLTKFPIFSYPQDTTTHPGLFWSTKGHIVSENIALARNSSSYFSC